MFDERYTTVVVGAGPAGVMSARYAAATGTVLLIDAARLPRDKSCGGMLNRHAQEFLSALAPVPDHVVLEPAHVHFRYVDWDRDIKKMTGLRFLNIDRRAFDDWLLSTLPESVSVVDRVQLVGILQDPEGVTAVLETPEGGSRVRCDYLIGADGARSSVRRLVGTSDVRRYVTLQDWIPLEGRIPPYFDCVYMRDVGDSFAYAYIVPKGDLAILGSVFYPRTKRPHEKHDQVIGELRNALPQLGPTARREASAALAVRSPTDVMPGVGRVLLAGEAGGFMSPTSGEGISYALNTGRLAGEAIASGDPEEALASYALATGHITRNIARKLKWLPVMESRAGKYLARFVPTPIISRMTTRL